MVCKSRKNRRNVKRGGSQGSGWEPGGALNNGLPNGLMVNRQYDACVSTSRPGQISYSDDGGLPGSWPRMMSGGRYENDLRQTVAGFPVINKLPCTPNHVNPLNQHGGVGVVSAKDMGVYEAPTARYTTTPSQFASSVGTPILLNQPLNPTAWSKACNQTAGRRREVYRKKSNKSRKNRKTRKNRK
jgi:hypothetical protein